MKISTYQEKGCLPGKRDMEDRILADHNVLSSGYHYIEDAGSGIYAVCDGVGGHAGGSYASFYAISNLALIEVPVTPDVLIEKLNKVHLQLVQKGSMATTITAISISDDWTHLIHIGNCRLYGFINGYLCQISRDQTRVEDLLRLGYSAKDIPESEKTVINACLGFRRELIEKMVSVDITKQFNSSERMLLSSDGVHDHVSVDDLELFMKGDISKETLQQLAKLSRDNGSKDDISILVIEK